MSRLVVDLGKATGEKLSVATVCANDVLLISANGVSASDLFAVIAKVDAGQWTRSGDGFIFGPDVTARQTEENHEKERAGARLQTLISKRLTDASAAAAKKPDGENPDTEVVSPFGMPGGAEDISMLRLLKGLDPASMVLDDEHRAVFSTNPNSMQLPLGSDASEIIAKIIADHNSSIKGQAAGADDLAGLDEKTMASIKEMISRQGKPVNGYSKADLVLSPFPFMGGTMATLNLYDNQGKILLSSTSSLDMSLFDQLMGKKPVTTGTKTPIELSPESQAFRKFSTTGQGQSQMASFAIPAGLKPYLFDSIEHDPLGLVPTDELFALAKSSHKPVVAVVPDNALSLLGALSAEAPTVEAFVKDLGEGKTMSMTESSGWIQIKPAEPEYSRQHRTDRAALAKFMHAVQDKKIPSLDDVAEFAQSAPSPMDAGVSQIYVTIFAPGDMGMGMNGVTSWNILRIYGQLTPDRRQALLSGQKVPLDSLTPPQQNSLVEAIFGPLAQLQVGDSAAPTDIMTTMMSMFGGGNDYKQESTELLPNGVPSGGVLEMTAQQEPFFIPVSDSGDGDAMRVVDMDEFAMLKYFTSQPAFAAAGGMMPKFGKMKVGSRTAYHLNFRLTDKIRMVGNLNDDSLPGDAETVDANNLPQNLADLIAKKAEDLKKSPLGSIAAMGALGGKGTPPPPR